MILSDRSLRALLPQLIQEPDESLVNPASVDIRIGESLLIERWDVQVGAGRFKAISLDRYTERDPFFMGPGEFALAATHEHLMVPHEYAVELRIKSSRAREGWDHSLAVWFDPGWDGIGTLEIRNATRYSWLPLWCGLRFCQLMVHQLDLPAERPYSGRYNHAQTVELSKDRPA